MMNSQNPFEQLQEDSVETHSLSPKVAETSNESRLQPQWLQSPNNSRRGNSSSFKNPAEETDEDDNWSISTNKNPKRSNITKYNRKQMLNLWKDLPLPAELANFPTIIVQKCLTPVALLPNEPQEEDPNKLYKSRFLPTRTTQPRGRSQPFTSRNRGRGRSDGQRMWSHERDRDFSRNTSVGRASDMEQHKRSVSHESEPESTKWFYKDPQGEVQGPFTDLEMNEWFEAGYFSDTLLVKQMHDPEFVELRLLFKKDGTSPFFASFEKEPNEDFSQTENQTTTEHLLMADKFGLSTNVPRESSNIMQPDKFWNKPNETWNRESSERDVWQTPAPTFVQRNVNDNTLKRKEGVFLLDHSGTTIPATNTIISTLASPPVVNPINSYSTNMLPMYVDPWQQRHPSMNLQHPPSAQTFPAHPIASRPIDPQSEAPVRMQEKRMPDIWTNSESRSWNSAEQHLVPEQHTPATFAQLNTQINVVEEIKLTPSQTEQVTEPTENEKPATTVTDNKSKSQKKKEKNQKQKKQPDIKPEVKPETTKNQPTQPAAPWVPPPTESRKLSLKDIQEEELRNKKQAPQINDSNEIPDSNKQGSVASSVNPAPAKQEQKKDSSTNNPTGPAWGVSAIPKSTPRSFKEIQDAEVNVKQTTEEKKKESTPAISPQPKKPASIINPVNAAPAPKPTAAVINPEEFPSLPSQPKQSKQPKAPVAKANTVVPNNNPLTVANHNTKAQAQPTTQPKQSKSQSKKKGLVKVDPSMLSFSVTNSSRVMGEIESFDN